MYEEVLSIGLPITSSSPISSNSTRSKHSPFPEIDKYLGEKGFGSKDEIMAQMKHYFKEINESYFLGGIRDLEKRWTDWVERKRDCFWKWIVF